MIDIVPGDVVVCVDAWPWSRIRPRDTYRVSTTFITPGVRGREVNVCLHGVDPSETVTGGYWAGRFRKVKKADTDFTEYMRKMRPAEKRVDA